MQIARNFMNVSPFYDTWIPNYDIARLYICKIYMQYLIKCKVLINLKYNGKCFIKYN